MQSRVMYPGSFDPPTLGHVDLISRARKLFEAVVVAVGVNPEKRTLFSVEERTAMMRESTAELDGVQIVSFHGLVVDCARRERCRTLLRGLRTVSDFESEYQMALTNRALSGDVDTVFLVASEEHAYVSSRLIKEIAVLGGDASRFLPPGVAERVRRKMKGDE